MSQSKRRRVTVSAKLMLSLSALLLSFVLVEAGLRLFLPQVLETPKDIYAPDSLLGYRMIPNLDRRFSEFEWNTRVVTNSRGFRGSDTPFDKNLNTKRIIGIGDSFLFGFGVDENESFLTRIYDRLKPAMATGLTLETINLGVPGFCVSQYQSILCEEAYKYHPDLVVIFFYLNDFQERHTKTNFQVSDDGYLLTIDEHGVAAPEKFSFTSIRAASTPLRAILKKHSHAYTFFKSRLINVLQRWQLMEMDGVVMYRKDFDLEKQYAYTFDVVRQMHQYCRDKNMAFLFCVIPEKQQVIPEYRRRVIEIYGYDEQEFDWLKPQASFKNFCAQQGIEYLDLAPAFSKASNNNPLYFNVDIHLTRDGHDLVAAEVAEYIRQRGLLETNRKTRIVSQTAPPSL